MLVQFPQLPRTSGSFLIALFSKSFLSYREGSHSVQADHRRFILTYSLQDRWVIPARHRPTLTTTPVLGPRRVELTLPKWQESYFTIVGEFIMSQSPSLPYTSNEAKLDNINARLSYIIYEVHLRLRAPSINKHGTLPS
ncbi:hypothetical protein ABKN59_003502 [Abortiporus biennis]